MRYRATVIAFVATWLALTVACGPGPKGELTSNDFNWPTGETVMVRGRRVTLPLSAQANLTRRAQLLASVTMHVETFELDHGAQPKTPIGVSDWALIPCWSDPTPVYLGCWCRTRTGRATILVAPQDDTVPALYHELMHDKLGPGHGEDDAGKRALWAVADVRGQWVVDQLRAARARSILRSSKE